MIKLTKILKELKSVSKGGLVIGRYYYLNFGKMSMGDNGVPRGKDSWDPAKYRYDGVWQGASGAYYYVFVHEAYTELGGKTAVSVKDKNFYKPI